MLAFENWWMATWPERAVAARAVAPPARVVTIGQAGNLPQAAFERRVQVLLMSRQPLCFVNGTGAGASDRDPRACTTRSSAQRDSSAAA